MPATATDFPPPHCIYSMPPEGYKISHEFGRVDIHGDGWTIIHGDSRQLKLWYLWRDVDEVKPEPLTLSPDGVYAVISPGGVLVKTDFRRAGHSDFEQWLTSMREMVEHVKTLNPFTLQPE